MVIFFFISIIALIAIVLFTINPITRAVNNSIANELKDIRREAEKLREKLKLETEINAELRKEDTELHSRKMLKEVTPEVVNTFLDDYKV